MLRRLYSILGVVAPLGLQAQTFIWNLPNPPVVASGVAYTVGVSASGPVGGIHTLYKNGNYFASGSYYLSRTTTDYGVQTVTYTSTVLDPVYLTGGSDSRSVTISAPPTAPTVSITVPSTVTIGVPFSIAIDAADINDDLSSMGIRLAQGNSLVGGPWAISGGTASASTSVTLNTTGNFQFRGEVWDAAGNGVTTPWQTVTVSPPTYTLRVDDGSGGGSGFIEGQWINVSANSPPSGFFFEKWGLGSMTGTIENYFTSSTRFRMGAGNGWIFPVYTAYPKYTVTVITANGSTTRGELLEGSGFPISAQTPAGYVFSGWTVSGPGAITDPSAPDTGFRVGAGNATLTAIYLGAAISANPSTGVAPGFTTVAWTSSGATSVTVTGPGISTANSTVPNGSQEVSGLPAGTHTYTITAQRAGVSVAKTATFTVAPNPPPTIEWVQAPASAWVNTPFTVQARARDANGNLSNVQMSCDGRTLSNVSGTGSQLLTEAVIQERPTTGPTTFIATATDAQGLQASGALTVNILNADGTTSFAWGTIAASTNPGLPASTVGVGVLSGSLSVTSNGSANYVVPLTIPPGRGGMEPELSLTYSSGGGNGPLGVGWSLSHGFPQFITRGRSILARDDEVRGVNFDAKDKFYLDGKRLICTSEATHPYGTPFSTYRTEVDSFVTITTTGTGTNIETFTVTDKLGRVFVFGRYGGTTDGYQKGGGPGETLAHAYALKHVEDTMGNAVDLDYVEIINDSGIRLGEYVPSEIRYTANPGQAIPAKGKITFHYNLVSVGADDGTERSDRSVTYLAGRAFAHSRRLDAINVEFDGTRVAYYTLGYEYAAANGRTRLTSITPLLRDPAGTSFVRLRPTTFEWTTETAVTGTVQPQPLPSTAVTDYGLRQYAFGDFDGDGKSDYLSAASPFTVYRATQTGYEAGAVWFTGTEPFKRKVALGDFNGDGKQDLLYLVGRTLYALKSGGTPAQPRFEGLDGGAGATLVLDTSNIFKDPVATVTTYDLMNREGIAIFDRITVADFTGDGLDDILLHGYDGYTHLLKSQGSGFAAPRSSTVKGMGFTGTPQYDWSLHYLGNLFPPEHYTIQPMPCDLNGDGMQDYASVVTLRDLQPGSLYTLRRILELRVSQGNGDFSAPFQLDAQTVSARGAESVDWLGIIYAVLPADVNGDGLTDFMVLGDGKIDGSSLNPDAMPKGARRRWTLFVNRGVNSSNQPIFNTVSGPLPNTIVSAGESINTFYSAFTGLYDSALLTPQNHYQDPGYKTLYPAVECSGGNGMRLIDVNGDGFPDLVWYAWAAASTNASGNLVFSEANSTNKGWWVMYGNGGPDATGAYFGHPARLTDPGRLSPGQTPTVWEKASCTPTTGSSQLQFSENVLSNSVDINGDGRPDWTFHTSITGEMTRLDGVALGQGAPGDLLTLVVDGLDRHTDVSYKAAKDDTVYTPGAAVSYPIRDLRSSAPVVSEVWHDSGVVGQPAKFAYQYSGNRVDLSGRGALGFHSFVTLDLQTRIFKYQFLTQSFPMTGLTHREETYRWLGPDRFSLLSSHDNTVVFDKVMNGSTAYGTLFPFISRAVESRWEDLAAVLTTDGLGTSARPESLYGKKKPAGAHITVTAESQFDDELAAQTGLPPTIANFEPSDTIAATESAPNKNVVAGTGNRTEFNDLFVQLRGHITYGNLTQLTTRYSDDGYGERVVTRYYPPTSTGITGLVLQTQTSVWGGGHGAEESPQKAPLKSYTYWKDSTPLVATEKVDASLATNGDATLTTTTTYSRDALGRVTAISVSGTDLLAKGAGPTSFTSYTATEFNPRFDLPTEEKNAYGHITRTDYSPIFGKPTSVSDANGVVIRTTYDALGRVIDVTRNINGTLLSTNSQFAFPDTPGAGSWKATVTVAPPAGSPDDDGVELTSAYALRTTITGQPSVTTYYDRLGRAIRSVKDGFGTSQAITDTAYNLLGQVVGASLPSLPGSPLWTRTVYDALGRVKTVIAPNDTVTTTTYNGRLTTVRVDAPNLGGVNPDPQENTTLVDAKGRTVKVWNADNSPGDVSGTTGLGGNPASVAFDLDGFGRMRETVLKDQTQTITAQYDALGRQTQLNDPDKGPWKYVNSALGHVLEQTDARGTVTRTTYDPLGRALVRTTTELAGPVETGKWYYYDTAANAAEDSRQLVSALEKGWIGALQREESSTANAPGYAAGNAGANSKSTTVHCYNAKGLPELSIATLDDKWFYTHTKYDEVLRPKDVRHYWRPAGLEAPDKAPYVWQDFGYSYSYDSKGYLLAIRETDKPERIWWKADPSDGYDYLDRPVLVQKGSGYWTKREYRPADGVLTAIKTGATTGTTEIQNLALQFDGLGNLTSRTAAGLSETYRYDNLNRLTTRNGTTISSYEPNGNIRSKVDVNGVASGKYDYYVDSRPHAVWKVRGFEMGYDANGNLVSRTGTATGERWDIRYAGFDKPRWMAKTVGGVTAGSEFLYNANRSRTLQLEFNALSGGVPSGYLRKRVYAFGGTMEMNYRKGTDPDAWDLNMVRIYVPGPDGVIGTREFSPHKPAAEQEEALVYHYDHLGSIDCITKFGATDGTFAADSGGKPGRFSEDAWGQRRNPFTWNGAPATSGANKSDDGGADSLTPRGFTSHEMLDDLGLIHMNGRIYDALLGRFLSADLVVQSPGSLQSYNRYTYVQNNPLSFTDPTGFFTEAEKRRWKAEAEARHAAIDKHGAVGLLLEGNSIIRAGDIAAAAATGGAKSAQPAATPAADQAAGIEAKRGDTISSASPATAASSEKRKSNSASIDPNGKGELGSYLVRQNEKGEWAIVGKTNGVTTKYAFVNGILGSLDKHARLGGRHMPKGVTEFTLFNNPSKGFLRDIAETAMDKLGFSSAPAKALAKVMQDIQASGNQVQWIAHSQGGAIFSEAMSYAMDHGSKSLAANSVTFNAGANNHWETNSIATDAGVRVDGYYYSSWDAVPNIIGLNGNPFSMLGSVLAAPLLFTDNHSPHSAPTSSWSKRH